MKRINLVLITLLISICSFASHVPGGNITYECVGPNQYMVTLTLFEDCGTAFEANGPEPISITNDCGLANPTGSLPNIIYQQEVSQLCPAQIGQSECNGGTLPGIYMHQWQDIITLPGCCDSWTFSYSSCCQNTSTNVSGQPGYYWESVLNNCTEPCNTSPEITAQPIPYVCVNQPVNYNLGASEPDGHTLVYSLIPGMSNATTQITYNGGYSGAVPIPGINIDPNTGQITFTPTATGNYVVVILIEEYDANGNLVGSIMHHIQFEVINCSNTNPNPPSAGITNYTGSGSVIASDAVEVCEGDSFCFDVQFIDPDVTDSLYLSSNVTTVLPGATFTVTYNAINDVTATVCWTAQPGMPNFNSFTINAIDNACPLSGMTNYPLEVHIISSTYAGPDETICLGQGVQLQASGGSNFNWTLISGDPITPANFSCTNCPNPIANPSITSTYEVTSNLTGGCVNIDTITVTVVPDFTYQINQSSSNSCLLDPIQVDVIPNPAGAYTYTWTAPAGTGNMSCTNCANPVITETVPGTYWYYVDIVSPGGCLKQDSLSIVVAAAYAPNITALADTDTLINCGDSVHLDVDLGGGIPAQCGANPVLCASTTPIASGTASGANTTTGYPAPFGNWYKNAKHQFLYTAAELNALGFIGGKISDIAWEVTQINGTTLYKGYEIRIGCTSSTSLTTWETGLTQVYGPTDITIAVGMNQMNFTQAYEWDGVSNLVIEICYNNLSDPSYTQNSITPWENTGYTSCLYYRSDGTPACPYTGFPTTSSNRPITHLGTCPSTPDPNNYSFSWSTAPASSLGTMDDPNIQTPAAAPQNPTWFTVTVTDNNGGCTDTDSVYVFIDCCDPSDVAVTDLTCNQSADGEISVTPLGTAGPFDIEIEDQTGALVYTANGVPVGGTDVATGLSAGTYTVFTIDATGCTHDTTVTLTEPTPFTFVINDTTICETGTATLIATVSGSNGGPFTLDWTGVGQGNPTVNPTNNTCYEVIATDVNGCVSQPDTMCVNLLPSLAGTATTSAVTICPGDQVTLDILASGGNGGPYTYSWDDGANAVGNTQSVTLSPTNPTTTYCVTVMDGCETPAHTSCVDVNVTPVPTVQFSSDVVDGCTPVVVNFSNDTDPALVGSCYWEFEGNGTSNDCNPSITFSDPGTYDVTLTITTPDGCVADSTATDMINVYAYPDAFFSFGPQPTTFFDPEIDFIDQSTTDVTIWDWQFGANGYLGSSTDQDPTFQFPNNQPGEYQVWLYATTANGCTDSFAATVVIDGIFTLYLPNAFSPNGDGINDIFMVTGEGIDETRFEFMIFDRWGEIVWSTKSLNEGWDGSINGISANAKTDVYVWKVKAADKFTGEKKEFYGHVTVLR